MPRTTHGMSKINGRHTRTYITWQRMKDRCLKPRASDFARYGGRGIQVCARWLAFENFLADMGERPEGKQLDRRDNDGNYEPGNCRWVTKRENARNRSSNRLVPIGGIARSVTEWGEISGLGETFRNRLNRGWSPERALAEPRQDALSRKAKDNK